VNPAAPQPFGPRFWLVTLAAIVAMVATASLGRWQLSRAAQKEALQAAIDARAALPPLRAGDLPGKSADELLHRRVALRGQWLPAATVFLDNRQMQGRAGFFVFTPLRVADGAVVLVQRGWAPRDFQDRGRLPPVDTPGGEVALEGRIAGPPARLYEFAAAAHEGASRIRQNLDLAAYGAETGLSLLPLTVVQTGADGEGLSRDWPPIDSGVSKHYGYAFQWFGLCGLVAILYVWFQFVRRIHRPGRAR